MTKKGVSKYVVEPAVQQKALHFALKGGSPREYVAAMNDRAQSIVSAQLKAMRASLSSHSSEKTTFE